MLKKHKNQILKEFRALGIDPLIFDVSEEETNKAVSFSVHMK